MTDPFESIRCREPSSLPLVALWPETSAPTYARAVKERERAVGMSALNGAGEYAPSNERVLQRGAAEGTAVRKAKAERAHQSEIAVTAASVVFTR